MKGRPRAARVGPACCGRVGDWPPLGPSKSGRNRFRPSISWRVPADQPAIVDPPAGLLYTEDYLVPGYWVVGSDGKGPPPGEIGPRTCPARGPHHQDPLHCSFVETWERNTLAPLLSAQIASLGAAAPDMAILQFSSLAENRVSRIHISTFSVTHGFG